jgi:transcription initiation factor TFIIIB Brf1 subunit/transcription initiation factor TFIIB
MALSPEAWPECPECGGRSFERRPLVSGENICLGCGYVSKAADERESINQSVEDESDKEASGDGSL